jgi:hypothetical protein
MSNLLQLWLNPIDLGIFFICITFGIWILAHCIPNYKDK